MVSARLAAALMTGILGASPANAVEVDVFYNARVVDPFGLTLAETGEVVASESVVLALEPRDLRTKAAQTGVGQAEQILMATGTLTNLLDAPLLGIIDVEAGAGYSVTFEAPNERAAFLANSTIRLGDQFFTTPGPGTEPFGPSAIDCPPFPCSESFSAGTGRRFEFTIGAGETSPVEFSVVSTVSALAPIPLPAALGPAALALGGLAWAGRRKLRR